MDIVYNKRRNRLEIYYDILCAINNKPLHIEENPFMLKQKTNLNNQRLIYYIIEMINKGFLFIENDKIFITENGYRFIINYEKLSRLTAL